MMHLYIIQIDNVHVHTIIHVCMTVQKDYHDYYKDTIETVIYTVWVLAGWLSCVGIHDSHCGLNIHM